MSMSEWDGSNKPNNARGAGAGWEFITNPLGYLGNVTNWRSRNPQPGTTIYGQGYTDSQGIWHQGSQPGFSLGGSGGSTSGSSAATSAGDASPTFAPETLSAIPQSTSTTGLTSGIALPTGSSGAGSIAIAGSGPSWGAYAKAGLTAASAYQNAKDQAAAAKAAGQAQNTTRTPYMSNMLNPFIPYILQEALNIYAQRQKNATGRVVGDYNPLAAILGQFFNNYTR